MICPGSRRTEELGELNVAAVSSSCMRDSWASRRCNSLRNSMRMPFWTPKRIERFSRTVFRVKTPCTQTSAAIITNKEKITNNARFTPLTIMDILPLRHPVESAKPESALKVPQPGYPHALEEIAMAEPGRVVWQQKVEERVALLEFADRCKAAD